MTAGYTRSHGGRKVRTYWVARREISGGSAVPVTPTLYNTIGELDRFVAALRAEAAAFG